MKTTTKILIAVIILMLLSALILPRIIFGDNPDKNLLSPSGETVTVEPGRFKNIVIDKCDIYFSYQSDIADTEVGAENWDGMYIIIEVDSTATQPRVEMDKEWADNITLSLDGDSTLSLYVDLHAYVTRWGKSIDASTSDDDDVKDVYDSVPYVKVANGFNRLATIYIPADMTDTLGADLLSFCSIRLNGFNGDVSVMTKKGKLEYDGVDTYLKLNNCNIPVLGLVNFSSAQMEINDSRIGEINTMCENVSFYGGKGTTINSVNLADVENVMVRGRMQNVLPELKIESEEDKICSFNSSGAYTVKLIAAPEGEAAAGE